jgi:hypothetical protein
VSANSENPRNGAGSHITKARGIEYAAAFATRRHLDDWKSERMMHRVCGGQSQTNEVTEVLSVVGGVHSLTTQEGDVAV